MSAPVIVFLDEPLPPQLDDPRQELGGKGVSLRRLHACGLRVPRGFTIGAGVCREFLRSGQWPATAWAQVVEAVRKLERQCAAASDCITGESSLLLAVRSGAAQSMPGLLQTKLNVGLSRTAPAPESVEGAPGAHVLTAIDPRPATHSDCRGPLREAIESVFRSWDSEPARRYRDLNRIGSSAGTAVTVQQMVPCDFAGVMLTRAPGVEDDGFLMIEAVQGGGELLVSGRSTPRQWLMRRDDPSSIGGDGRADGTFDPLEHRLEELCRVGLSLEDSFGHPLDIEWGFDGEGFVFFQARPLAASGAAIEPTEALLQEKERLREIFESGTRLLVRHNLSESLPSPTPMTWSLWSAFMSAGGGFGRLYRRLGYRPGPAARAGLLQLAAGRIYADPDRMAALFGRAFPLVYDPDELRRDPGALDRAPTRFDPQRLDPFLLLRLPELLWQTWRVHRRIPKLADQAACRFEQEVAPALLERVEEAKHVPLGELTSRQVLDEFERRLRFVMDEFAPKLLLPGMLGGIALDRLQDQVLRVLRADAGIPLLAELTPQGDTQLVRRQLELLKNASGSDGKETFLTEFGHRCVGEMELAVPRWREVPQAVEQLARPQTSGDDDPPAVANVEVALQRLSEAFAEAGTSGLLDPAASWLRRAWTLVPYRDRGRHLFLTGYELLRDVLEELARRCDLADGGIYYLRKEDLSELVAGADLRDRIHRRRQHAQAVRTIHLSDVIEAGRLDEAFAATRVTRETTAALRGKSLVAGSGSGTVRRLCLPADVCIRHQEAGGAEVLVCRSLEPGMVGLLQSSAAVVVEQGGALSHGALLARQFGVPVVRIEDAMQHLQDGEQVCVDGNTGCVQRLRQGSF
jgi:rifampicin phosphotransferase